MDIVTIIGLVLAWVCLLGSAILEGIHGGESPIDILAAFLKLPPAILVFGGTLGAGLTGLRLHDIKEIPKHLAIVFKGVNSDAKGLIQKLSSYAVKSRRDGILALEPEIDNVDDPFLKKGLQLAVDGVDVDHMRTILELDLKTLKQWFGEGAEFFIKLGGFSPTLGIIGTVMGLVNMLKNISSPDTMGPAIASAFIATLYGICFANLVYLPIANKIRKLMNVVVIEKQMMMEGILGIQAGMSPRLLEEQLMAFIHGEHKENEGGAK
jgi:chemotaxis protein MotA